MATNIYQSKLDASLLGNNYKVGVGPHSWVTVQVSQDSGGTTTGAVFNVKGSIDGAHFQALPTPKKILGTGVTLPIDVRGIGYLSVEVATADTGGPAVVTISVYCN